MIGDLCCKKIHNTKLQWQKMLGETGFTMPGGCFHSNELGRSISLMPPYINFSRSIEQVRIHTCTSSHFNRMWYISPREKKQVIHLGQIIS